MNDLKAAYIVILIFTISALVWSGAYVANKDRRIVIPDQALLEKYNVNCPLKLHIEDDRLVATMPSCTVTPKSDIERYSTIYKREGK